MRKKRFGFFNKQKQFEQEMLERGVEYEYSSFYADSFKQLKKNKMVYDILLHDPKRGADLVKKEIG